MFRLKLTIIDDLVNSRLIPSLSPEEMPEFVDADIRTGGEVPPPPSGGAMLILTENAALARSTVDLPDTYVVFVGEYEDAADIVWKLYDLWADWDGKYLHDRALMTVSRILYRYEKIFHKHLLDATIDTVPDMLWYKRLDGIHTMVNTAFTDIVHRTREDCIGKDHFYIWDAPRPEEGNDFACAESEETAISTGKTSICDEPVTTREGLKQFTTYKTPIYDPFGNVYGTVGVGHDVTNFSNLGIELAILVESLPFPMVIFTPDHKVVRMNSDFAGISGADIDNTDDFDYPRWKASCLTAEGEAAEDKGTHSVIQEFRMEVPSGTRYYKLTELEIHDFFGNLSGYFVTLQDLTYQRNYEKTIIKAANTDTLTGINNRRFFYNYLAANYRRPMILFYMDLNGFKAINDEFGHNKGDEVLIRTAEFLKAYFPSCTCARLGGDEFIVAADLRDETQARSQMIKFDKALTDYFAELGIDLSISVGISKTDGVSQDMDAFVHEADMRMYEAKKKCHRKSGACPR
ncbi:MAG: diguanylate cyclase [Oscillospiraceae bacterium]|nr:diguanylate cyclase [Oscillospiraceae bacterium]